ncbi:MAG: zinc-finger domain-containing protein [Woeseia sp.]
MADGIAIIPFLIRMVENGDTVAAKTGTIDENLIPANSQHRYEVRTSDLPLSCPMPGMYLWNSHPKVYLPIAETGEAKCAYCGAEYYLVTDED